MRRLKIEKNGAVTDAMRDRGANYNLNYGVSATTIKAVAGPYAPDHELAQALWQQDVRELKIAAIYIDNPELITSDQMNLWSATFAESDELASHSSMQLFALAPCGVEVAMTWALGSPHPHQRLSACYILGKAASRLDPKTAAQFIEAAQSEELHVRSLPYAIREIFRHHTALRNSIIDLVNTLASQPRSEAISKEIGWQIEYLD